MTREEWYKHTTLDKVDSVCDYRDTAYISIITDIAWPKAEYSEVEV